MYRSEAVDKLLDDAVATLDQERRRRLYYELQDAIDKDVPAPTLAFRKGLWGINNRVRGVTGGERGLGPYTQWYTRPWMREAFVIDGK